MAGGRDQADQHRSGEAGEVAVRIVRAAVGTVPLAGSALAELVDYFWQRWQQPRVEAYVEEVAREAATKAWNDEVFGDEQSAELIARGLRAAMDADSDVKAQALGRVVSAGVGGDRPIDEARLIVASLARIEDPHIRVLAAMATPRPGGAGYPEGTQLHGQVSEDLIIRRVPAVGTALGAVMSVLQAEGLAFRHGRDPYAGISSAEWSLTPHGNRMLEYVRARAAPSTDDMNDA